MSVSAAAAHWYDRTLIPPSHFVRERETTISIPGPYELGELTHGYVPRHAASPSLHAALQQYSATQSHTSTPSLPSVLHLNSVSSGSPLGHHNVLFPSLRPTDRKQISYLFMALENMIKHINVNDTKDQTLTSILKTSKSQRHPHKDAHVPSLTSDLSAYAAWCGLTNQQTAQLLIHEPRITVNAQSLEKNSKEMESGKIPSHHTFATLIQEMSVYFIGLHELARQVWCHCAERGDLLHLLLQRCSLLLQTILITAQREVASQISEMKRAHEQTIENINRAHQNDSLEWGKTNTRNAAVLISLKEEMKQKDMIVMEAQLEAQRCRAEAADAHRLARLNAEYESQIQSLRQQLQSTKSYEADATGSIEQLNRIIHEKQSRCEELEEDLAEVRQAASTAKSEYDKHVLNLQTRFLEFSSSSDVPPPHASTNPSTSLPSVHGGDSSSEPTPSHAEMTSPVRSMLSLRATHSATSHLLDRRPSHSQIAVPQPFPFHEAAINANSHSSNESDIVYVSIQFLPVHPQALSTHRSHPPTPLANDDAQHHASTQHQAVKKTRFDGLEQKHGVNSSHSSPASSRSPSPRARSPSRHAQTELVDAQVDAYVLSSTCHFYSFFASSKDWKKWKAGLTAPHIPTKKKTSRLPGQVAPREWLVNFIWHVLKKRCEYDSVADCYRRPKQPFPEFLYCLLLNHETVNGQKSLLYPIAWTMIRSMLKYRPKCPLTSLFVDLLEGVYPLECVDILIACMIGVSHTAVGIDYGPGAQGMSRWVCTMRTRFVNRLVFKQFGATAIRILNEQVDVDAVKLSHAELKLYNPDLNHTSSPDRSSNSNHSSEQSQPQSVLELQQLTKIDYAVYLRIVANNFLIQRKTMESNAEQHFQYIFSKAESNDRHSKSVSIYSLFTSFVHGLNPTYDSHMIQLLFADVTRHSQNDKLTFKDFKACGGMDIVHTDYSRQVFQGGDWGSVSGEQELFNCIQSNWLLIKPMIPHFLELIQQEPGVLSSLVAERIQLFHKQIEHELAAIANLMSVAAVRQLIHTYRQIIYELYGYLRYREEYGCLIRTSPPNSNAGVDPNSPLLTSSINPRPLLAPNPGPYFENIQDEINAMLFLIQRELTFFVKSEELMSNNQQISSKEYHSLNDV